jgi:hypothetical protein
VEDVNARQVSAYRRHENLIGSIAAGVRAETVAPEIRSRELEISRLEVRLRAPLPETPRIDDVKRQDLLTPFRH